jgi:hypothetical protein
MIGRGLHAARQARPGLLLLGKRRAGVAGVVSLLGHGILEGVGQRQRQGAYPGASSPVKKIRAGIGLCAFLGLLIGFDRGVWACGLIQCASARPSWWR